jgi:hypothetical protein
LLLTLTALFLAPFLISCVKIGRDNHIYMEGQGNKNGLMWAIGGLALVVVVLISLSLVKGKSGVGKLYPNVTPPQLVATAPSGKIVAGMPQDLIFDKDAVIEKSAAYTTKSPSGMAVSVYTLAYKTAATVQNLYITYSRYAAAHGYAPMNGSLKTTTATYSFRSTETPDTIFLVTITDNGGTDREVLIQVNKQ